MKRLIVCIICCLYAVQVYAAQNIMGKSVTTKLLKDMYVSDTDVRLYKNIFRSIKNEEISVAQKMLKKLDSPILLGHVLAEIYLSKTYQTSGEELLNWLEKYRGLPQAKKIYNLAVSKLGKNVVVKQYGEEVRKIYSPYSWFSNQYEELSQDNRTYVRKQVTDFRRAINKGKTKIARQILETKKFRMIIPDREYDAMSTTLATVYLLDNQNQLAWQWVQKAAYRSKDAMAYWIGGLAAWKLHNYANSADFFAKLGVKTESDEWLVAAGAYWAYRALNQIKKQGEAQKWLKVAAKYKRTFYGMLATYQLGLSWNYNWQGVAFFNDYSSDDYIKEMLASEAIQRAIVLLQAKNPVLAEQEIRAEYKNMNKQQKEALLFLAQRYEMHSLAILLANDIKDNEAGVFYDEAAYPVPDWKPKGGWKIDNAFVWALVRQESAFSPTAKSGAGAKGLMQLMPATAVYITKNPELKKKDNNSLFEKDYNLALGQKYVQYLAEKPFINRNMFFVIAAYNAGPGNLYKWQKNVQYNNDPLLFIEIIPARETRIYIERVMANYWMYQARFGRSMQTIEQLANGEWPVIGNQ